MVSTRRPSPTPRAWFTAQWVQAYFRFRVPEHGVSELFLFAGSVVEPDITLDRTRVDYGALMIGAVLKETFHIVNREGMPHSFVFDKSSLGIAQVWSIAASLRARTVSGSQLTVSSHQQRVQ